MKKVIGYSLANATTTLLYIVLVASLIALAQRYFQGPDPDTILIPVFMLLLFVFSAAVTASLVLGRPIIWYLNGKKKEAITMFIYTIAFLFIFLVLAATALAVFVFP